MAVDHTADVHAAVTLGNGTTTTVTTAITSPVSPRCLSYTVTAGGATTPTGSLTITGTDAAGTALTGTYTYAAAGTYFGDEAFKTVTTMTLPARTQSGDTIAIGTRDALFDVSSARAFSNAVLATVSDYPTATITAKALEILDRFERYLGVKLLPVSVVETLSGDDTSAIMLGAHNPVLEVPRRPVVVSACKLDGTNLTATELLDVFADCDGLMHRDGSYWPATEPHNVVATYYAGWSTVPLAIKRAALIVCVNEIPTSNWSDRATSVSDGVMNAQLVTAGVRGAATSLPEVNAILDAYRETGLGIA